MRRLLTTISAALGITETNATALTELTEISKTEISNAINSDIYTPWKCIHHALRITVQILRPFVMSRIHELYSQCLLQKEQNKWDEKQLLNFLIDFDRRFEDRKKGKTPKGTVMQNTEAWTWRQFTVTSIGWAVFFLAVYHFFDSVPLHHCGRLAKRKTQRTSDEISAVFLQHDYLQKRTEIHFNNLNNRAPTQSTTLRTRLRCNRCFCDFTKLYVVREILGERREFIQVQ